MASSDMRMDRWTIPDLIDFEYVLTAEGQPPDASVRTRDRRIFLDAVEPRIGMASTASRSFRRDALRIWLDERKAQLTAGKPQAVFPGDAFRESRALLRIMVAI